MLPQLVGLSFVCMLTKYYVNHTNPCSLMPQSPSTLLWLAVGFTAQEVLIVGLLDCQPRPLTASSNDSDFSHVILACHHHHGMQSILYLLTDRECDIFRSYMLARKIEKIFDARQCHLTQRKTASL